MTIDIQEASRIYQAGINVGRNMAKHEADEFAKISGAPMFSTSDPGVMIGHQTKSSVVSLGTTAGVVKIAPPPKAAITRGVKKEPMTRTKGVKEAILALIASGPMSAGEIISSTGFKGTSVRATLMSLKKSGLAMSDSGQWAAIHHDGIGNSDGNGEAGQEVRA